MADYGPGDMVEARVSTPPYPELAEKIAGVIYTVSHVFERVVFSTCADCGRGGYGVPAICTLTTVDAPAPDADKAHCFCAFRPLRRPPGALRIVCEGVPEGVGA